MDMKDLYFNWMCEIVFPNIYDRQRYRNLLITLNSLIFHYSIPMDENRMRDGIDLRYRFAYDNGYSNDRVTSALSENNSCSMLEMMVALALKGDERILYDYETGSKADFIFMLMLQSLQIENMVNENLDVMYVEDRVDRLLNHEYDYNGYGGLFTVGNPRRDMRLVDIWYQMSWAIQELYE